MHLFFPYYFRSKLEETKEKQKLRNKPNGVNILTLAVGKKITVEEEVTNVGFIFYIHSIEKKT